MVNKHGESQCGTGRGSRQMPRHLLLSLFDNLHCSLMNVHQPTILNVPGTGCLSLKTQGSTGHSEKRASQSLCVQCSCMEVHGQCREQCEGQHGQRLFRAAVFSQLQLTLLQPASPLQACVSDF